MNRSRQRCSVFGRQKTRALIAGLVWHPLISEDPVDREHGVFEFSQSYDARSLVVSGDSQCLQLGYPANPQQLKEHPMVLSFHSLAVEIRLLSQADVVLALMRMDDGDFIGHYGVVLYEKTVLVLDMVSTGLEASGVYENHRSLFGADLTFEVYSNDTDKFPDATPLSLESLLAKPQQQSLLRRPRKPRLKKGLTFNWRVAAKYTAGLAVSAAAAWWGGGLITDFNTKKDIDKVKQAEREYLRAVQMGLSRLGVKEPGLMALMEGLNDVPVSHDGWYLVVINCGMTECTQTWRGEPFWASEELAGLGKIKSEKNTNNALEVLIVNPVKVEETGILSTSDLPTRKAVNLFCKREVAFFKDLKLTVKCDAQGKPWPRKVSQLKPESIVTEHLFEISVDSAELRLLLDRVGQDVHWREVGVRMADLSRQGSKSVSAIRYELKGALYAYR